MSKRFYEVEIHPKNDECPNRENKENNCNKCVFCKYIGTFEGKFYVDCEYNVHE